MTPEEQVIAVLEWLGWKDLGFFQPPTSADEPEQRKPFWRGHPPGKGLWRILPDLGSDLNAIHDAWKKLNRKQRISFSQNLRIIVVNSGGHAASFKEDIDACCENAEAPQRLEALARTLFPERFK